MAINEQLLEIIETLEAIRFLTHSWTSEPETVLAHSRTALTSMNREGRLRLRADLRSQLAEIRDHYGAFASDETLRGMLPEARQQKGYVYLPKRFIDAKLFSRFDRVFSRWPFMPPHALVVYDPQTHRPLNSIYQAEIELYRDAQHMLSRAKAYYKDIVDFRKRDPEDQRLLQSYLRSAATATFQTLEAFLNAIAYDCFTEYHDFLALEDHDVLGEWNTEKKRRMFVAFERKLKEYPRIAASARGKSVDVPAWECSGFILEVGKTLRDAITHPSPFVDPHTKENEKTFWLVGINLETVELLATNARQYMQNVAAALYPEPARFAPWLFE